MRVVSRFYVVLNERERLRGKSTSFYFRGGTIIRTELQLYYRETIAVRVDNSVLSEALALT